MGAGMTLQKVWVSCGLMLAALGAAVPVVAGCDGDGFFRQDPGSQMAAKAAASAPSFTVEQRQAVRRAMMLARWMRLKDFSLEKAEDRLMNLAMAAAAGTGTPSANFQGNTTAVNAGPGNLLVMLRQANCSLTSFSASYTPDLPQFNYTVVGQTANEDQALHTAAGLTTTGGKWATGCGDQTLGMSAEPVVYVGTTTAGNGIFAGVVTGNQIEVVVFNATNEVEISSGELSGVTASGLAAADVNGDGNPDLIAVNNPTSGGSPSIEVMLGNADGTFQAPVSYALPQAQGNGLVIDDFNGDGKPDIVASSSTVSSGSSGETITWELTFLAGNGDGTFKTPQSVTLTPPTGYTGAGAYTGLISASVLGNGKKDLVTAAGILLMGNGDGTFTQSTTTVFPGGPSSGNNVSVAAGDFNNDGKLDLAFDNTESIAIYLGNGSGGFTAAGSWATIDNNGRLAANDLDGDGNVDLFTGTSRDGAFASDGAEPGQAYALMGHGDGTFAGAPLVPFAFTGRNLVPMKTGSATLTGMGMTATLNSTNVSVTAYPLNTNGTFSTGPTTTLSPVTIGGTPYTFQSFASFGFGDFNGDGNTDMILVVGPLPNGLNPDWGFMLLTGNGDGSFNAPTLLPEPNFVPGGAQDEGANLSSMMVADVNGDGKPDLIYSYNDTASATQTQYAGIAVQLGNGDGTFQAPKTIQTYSGAGGVTGEAQMPVYVGAAIPGGKVDLFAIQTTLSNQTLTSKLMRYPGNGDGTFGAAVTMPTADNFEPPAGVMAANMALADMNGDGKPDLVTLGVTNNGEQGEIAIALGNGDGTFNTPVILDFGDGPTLGDSLAVTDFNGDGKLDLAVGGFNPPEDTGLFFGNGDGTLQSYTTTSGIVEPAQGINFPGYGAAMPVELNGKTGLILGPVVMINQGIATSTLTPTTTTLAASATTITAGQNVTFTATVSASTTPAGNVTFMDGSTTLGTTALNGSGVATYSTTALGVGTHSITAVYAGGTTFAGSTSAATSITVNSAGLTATTTTLTASATSVSTGTSVTFTGTVAPSSGSGTPTGSVTFMDGTASLGMGTLSSGTATYATSSLAAGTHSITAVYGGDTNFSGSTSSALAVTVTAATPSFSIGASPSSGSVTAGGSTQTTITVTPANGFNQQVSFACTGLPAGGSCSFTPTTVTPNGSAGTTTVTIATTAQSAAVAWPGRGLTGTRAATAFAMLAGGLVWVFRRRRKLGEWTRGQLGVLLVVTAAALVTGCGGSKGSTGSGGGTTPQMYTVTITATAGSESQTASYSLTVN